MKVLVVGFGSIGRRHATNLRRLGAEVFVHDLNPARLNDALVKCFQVPSGDLGGDRFDAVVIATPASSHADDMRAWQHLPIFVEKPLATSVLESYQTPRTWVGYNWRYHRQILALKAKNPKPVRLLLSCSTDIETWPGRNYAHPILECSHEVDLIRWWRGQRPALVHVARGQHWCCMDFAGGDRAKIAWRQSVMGRTISGLKGRPTITISLGLFVERSYRDEMRAFMAWVQDGCRHAPGCSVEEGLDVLRICEAAIAVPVGQEVAYA